MFGPRLCYSEIKVSSLLVGSAGYGALYPSPPSPAPQSRYGFGRKWDICTPINMIIPLAVRQFITCSSAGVLYHQQGTIQPCFPTSRRKLFPFFPWLQTIPSFPSCSRRRLISFLPATGDNPLLFFLLQETIPCLNSCYWRHSLSFLPTFKETTSFFSSCSRREYISFFPVS